MAAWFDEDEQKLWMLEYERHRGHDSSTKTSVQLANAALAEVRAMGVFDEPDDSAEVEEEEEGGTFDQLASSAAYTLLDKIDATRHDIALMTAQARLNQIEALMAEALDDDEA